jgi:hypothetical protein
MAEGDVIHQTVAGYGQNGLVGLLGASWFVAHAWMTTFALEHYEPSVAQKGDEREAIDLGGASTTAGYALLQAHYLL